jgi:hypothetical protein
MSYDRSERKGNYGVVGICENPMRQMGVMLRSSDVIITENHGPATQYKTATTCTTPLLTIDLTFQIFFINRPQINLTNPPWLRETLMLLPTSQSKRLANSTRAGHAMSLK